MAFRHGQSPYDFPAMASQAPVIQQPIFPFLYPPPSLVPLSPLALVSYRAAKWAVVAANHLLVPLLAYLLVFRLSRFPNPAFALFICAFLLLSFPVTQTIVHDQVNIAVTVLICLCWLGVRRHDAWWPGIPLALAVLLKQSPVILIALLALERRWRALFATLTAVVVALVISVVTVSGEAWTEWLEVIRPSLVYGKTPVFLFSPACPYNQSLNGMVSRLFLAPNCTPTELIVPAAGRTMAYALALGIVGLSFAGIRALRRCPSEIRINRGFALLLPAMFLVSPLSWEHHLVFVLPSVVIALNIVVNRSRSFITLSCLLAVCILGIALPLPIDHPFLRHDPWIHLISFRTYTVVLLWVVLLLLSLERPRASVAGDAEEGCEPVSLQPLDAELR
jgi:alpha-1,2-mannosyltransferase